MYRAVTLYAMQNNLIEKDCFDNEQLVKRLEDIEISFKFNENLGFAEVYLNGQNVEKHIRTLEVSQFVSQVATVSEVREQLVLQQQVFGKDKGVVMDGRDIGTVVFPEAELKLFMTASAEKRALRRYEELIERGDSVSFEDVLLNVQTRDHIDSTREDSPLSMAEDAIKVDNSNLTLDEQFKLIYNLANDKITECH